MPSLSFDCLGARPLPYSVAPAFALDVELMESTGTRVHAVALRCQLRIEPQRRRYTTGEEEDLVDLFGEPHRWGDTLKPMQLAAVTALVTGFDTRTTVALEVPCTYDTEVASAKYFRALEGGEIPLLLLFSGTVFYAIDGGYQIEQIPWDREVSFRLPVAVWREVMAAHFPGTGWLRLHEDTIDALQRYRSARMLLSWEETFALLLKEAGAGAGEAGP